MPSPLTLRQDFPAAPADVYALLTDRDFLQARMEDCGGIDPSVVSIDAGDDQTTVVTRQSIPASVLPSMVASMIPGDPVTERTETWKADGEQYAAEFSVTVKGAPASLKGTMTIAAGDGDAAASTLQVDGQAAVPIPMFGPQIEKVIVEQIGQLLEAEGGYTRKRLAS